MPFLLSYMALHKNDKREPMPMIVITVIQQLCNL